MYVCLFYTVDPRLQWPRVKPIRRSSAGSFSAQWKTFSEHHLIWSKLGKKVLRPNSFPNSSSLIPWRRAVRFRPPFLNFTHWLLLLLPIQTLIWLSKRSPKAVNLWKKRASGALHKIRHLRSAPPSSADCCNYMCKWVIGKVFYAVRCG